MASLKSRGESFADRARESVETSTTRSLREGLIPPPPGSGRRGLASRLEDEQPGAEAAAAPVSTQAPAPAPEVLTSPEAMPAAPAPTSDASAAPATSLATGSSSTKATAPKKTRSGAASARRGQSGQVVPGAPARASESSPSSAPSGTITVLDAPSVLPGFTGEVAADGFPLPRSGEVGTLQVEGEELRGTTFRVPPELRQGLNQIRLWEKGRTGKAPELERVVDAALQFLPDDLDGIQELLAATPEDVRRPSVTQPLGTRLREAQFARLDDLPLRAAVEGRGRVKLAEVHRAVLWHYWTQYVARRQALGEDS